MSEIDTKGFEAAAWRRRLCHALYNIEMSLRWGKLSDRAFDDAMRTEAEILAMCDRFSIGLRPENTCDWLQWVSRPWTAFPRAAARTATAKDGGTRRTT